jgi:hypothetical protein
MDEMTLLKARFWWELKRRLPEFKRDVDEKNSEKDEHVQNEIGYYLGIPPYRAKEREIICKWGIAPMFMEGEPFLKYCIMLKKYGKNQRVEAFGFEGEYPLFVKTVLLTAGEMFFNSLVNRGVVDEMRVDVLKEGSFFVLILLNFHIKCFTLYESMINSFISKGYKIAKSFEEYNGPSNDIGFIVNKLDNRVEKKIDLHVWHILGQNGLRFKWPFNNQHKAKRLLWLIENDFVNFTETFPDWISKSTPTKLTGNTEYNAPDFWPETRTATDTDERAVRRDMEDLKRVTADVRKVAAKREACLGDMTH